jgi:hypothetical protein
MFQGSFKPGDCVVYRMSKHSTSPGSRAKAIMPATHGDDYSYLVDKYWVVAKVPDDHHVLVKTRRGKEHLLETDDPNLRRANWLERFLYAGHFPQLPPESSS